MLVRLSTVDRATQVLWRSRSEAGAGILRSPWPAGRRSRLSASAELISAHAPGRGTATPRRRPRRRPAETPVSGWRQDQREPSTSASITSEGKDLRPGEPPDPGGGPSASSSVARRTRRQTAAAESSTAASLASQEQLLVGARVPHGQAQLLPSAHMLGRLGVDRRAGDQRVPRARTPSATTRRGIVAGPGTTFVSPPRGARWDGCPLQFRFHRYKDHP